ncbi:MAG: GGDEF domain-containing protein [Gammaproteobacteria bacterium]|nr:GGDEF domain-containing protein [Gammaproteobacteria bacterium]
MNEKPAGNTADIGFSHENTIDDQVGLEHLRIGNKHALIITLGNLLASMLLVLGLSAHVENSSLLIWFGTMLVFNLFRYYQARKFLSAEISVQSYHHQERRYVLAVATSGILWGLTAVLFFSTGAPVQDMFIALVLMSMASAATASLSFHRFAYPLFVVPTISPLVLKLLYEGDDTQQIIGLVIPLYFGFLMVLSRQIFYYADQTIRNSLTNRQHAYVDYLTGIANRRAFDQYLQKEWFRGLRANQPLSLILMDIDDFKKLNDTYGHPFGDKTLQSIAHRVKSKLKRSSDLAARIGGEEFSIILPNTGLDGALSIAEEIQSEVTGSIHNPETSERVTMPTLSLGISCCYPDQRSSISGLYQQADNALYEAKHSGKNQVVLADSILS